MTKFTPTAAWMMTRARELRPVAQTLASLYLRTAQGAQGKGIGEESDGSPARWLQVRKSGKTRRQVKPKPLTTKPRKIVGAHRS